jgi:hypothetical protein
MKNLLAVILVLAAATAATAKPSPVEPARSANPIALASAEFNIGAAGATLERSYFRAPEADSHSGLYLCRFEPSMFAKVRLTQSCR